MRIAFCTATLEPGRDGVGDYTRVLARACQELGHECTLVALNDSFVDHFRAERLKLDSDTVPILRWSRSESWEHRGAELRAYLKAWSPTWTSFQFVPFGYQSRGYLQSVLPHLCAMRDEGQRLHLMLHELWIGEESGASLQDQIEGWWQRRGILELIDSLEPERIHTHASAYVDRLRHRGIKADRLPLFGNIPVTGGQADWLWEQIPSSHSGGVYPRSSSHWLFVLFGAVHPEWPPEPLFTEILAAARAAGRAPVVLSIGRSTDLAGHWDAMVDRYASDVTFLQLGPQPVRRISEVLTTCHFGLATTPLALLGKSGTVAAFLDHGLPVLVPRDDYVLPPSVERSTDPIEEHPLVHRVEPGLSDRLGRIERGSCRPDRARIIARRLLETLESPRPGSGVGDGAGGIIQRYPSEPRDG